MCLIVIGWRVHPDFPLVAIANRDEFYRRPSAFAARWADHPEVIGGRDLEAGGTWLAITDTGRFAAVTNVREPGVAPGRLSRGALTRDFLVGDKSAVDYASGLDGNAFSGFNLLVADDRELWYLSNRNGAPRRLPPGIYGLSNHLLDTPWPKLLAAKERFAAQLDSLPDTTDALFQILADDELAPDESLPSTGVPLAWERRLSAIFIHSQDYGTRASTLVMQHRDGGIRFEERAFGPEGVALQSSVISTGV